MAGTSGDQSGAAEEALPYESLEVIDLRNSLLVTARRACGKIVVDGIDHLSYAESLTYTKCLHHTVFWLEYAKRCAAGETREDGTPETLLKSAEKRGIGIRIWEVLPGSMFADKGKSSIVETGAIPQREISDSRLKRVELRDTESFRYRFSESEKVYLLEFVSQPLWLPHSEKDLLLSPVVSVAAEAKIEDDNDVVGFNETKEEQEAHLLPPCGVENEEAVLVQGNPKDPNVQDVDHVVAADEGKGDDTVNSLNGDAALDEALKELKIGDGVDDEA